MIAQSILVFVLVLIQGVYSKIVPVVNDTYEDCSPVGVSAGYLDLSKLELVVKDDGFYTNGKPSLKVV